MTSKNEKTVPQIIRDKFENLTPVGGQVKRSFSPVFKANLKDSDKQVILKWTNLSTSSPKHSFSIQNESLFNFQSDGLPSGVHSIQQDDFFIVYRDYKEGITLDEYWKTIKRKDRLNELRNIAISLFSILLKLEEMGIVHCDIKPSNILINENGSKGRIQLIDFGLALDTKNVNERSILFPLGYAAPELLLNKLKLVDNRTDIFSIGILFWRLLTGELPLKNSNPGIYTNLQLTHPIPDHSAIPKKWHEFILKATSKPHFRTVPNYLSNDEVEHELKSAMNNRFSSFKEMIHEIDAFETHQKWWKSIF